MTLLSPADDAYMSMIKSAALIAAARLGLFAALRKGPLTLPALSEKLGASLAGITTLVDALITVGYVEQQGERISLSEHAHHWFGPEAPIDSSAGLLWLGEAWDIMCNLSDAVKQGKPKQTLWERMRERPHMGPTFSHYMYVLAKDLLPELGSKLHLPQGARRLLDLGGSHGLNAIACCQRYPELSAVIADLESALTHTGRLIEQEGLSQRISVHPGNILDCDWGDGYDVIFYFWVAHNQTAEGNRKIIHHAKNVLRPGGLLVILESLADLPLSPTHAAFRLTLLSETSTRTYRYAEISEWLAEAGFSEPSRVELDPIGRGTLILARA